MNRNRVVHLRGIGYGDLRSPSRGDGSGEHRRINSVDDPFNRLIHRSSNSPTNYFLYNKIISELKIEEVHS